MIKSYKDLIVWQKSFDLSMEIYKETKSFPKEETYGLTSQIRRAAVSIPSNIAEGYSRQKRLEYVQFLQIAFASGAELETQLLLSEKLKLLNNKTFQELNNLLQEVMKMLNSLIRKIKTSA
jgi:four helix bundle protein